MPPTVLPKTFAVVMRVVSVPGMTPERVRSEILSQLAHLDHLLSVDWIDVVEHSPNVVSKVLAERNSKNG